MPDLVDLVVELQHFVGLDLDLQLVVILSYLISAASARLVEEPAARACSATVPHYARRQMCGGPYLVLQAAELLH
eukprot:SAG31_NODE_11671_length_1007_cov_378.452643_2_plen_75_part_00